MHTSSSNPLFASFQSLHWYFLSRWTATLLHKNVQIIILHIDYFNNIGVTWTGTVLKVVRTTSLHWCSLSPWPPTCSAAWWTRGRSKPLRFNVTWFCLFTQPCVVCVLISPTSEAMVKPITSMQPSSCRCGSKSR